MKYGDLGPDIWKDDYSHSFLLSDREVRKWLLFKKREKKTTNQQLKKDD